MNKLILCEGETDAILLSYYLELTCLWKHCNAPSGLKIRVEMNRGESAYWYQRDKDNLLICAVGSKDSFGFFFENRISSPLYDTDEAFSRIALVIDHDEESVSSIEEKIQSCFPPVTANAKNNKWIRNEYTNSYEQTKELDFLLLVIPSDQQGVLESLLLEAISENPYDKNIVEKSQEYVNRITPEATRYLDKRRLIPKAYLGVTWAIQSPQKVFKFIDEQIRLVQWEKSTVLSKCFHQIMEI